jgi:uncharacterized SAM-binding protein YcdF (DUF218 family)
MGGIRKLGLGLLAAVVGGGAALAVGFINFVHFAADARAPADPHAAGIVVLTGGAARIDNGLQLLVEGRGSRLLISGANPAFTDKTLADSFGSNFAETLACCVDVGHAARDTIGNAIETRKWAEQQHFDSLLVVTSDYHMRRSMAELADAMPNVRLLPVPINNPDLHIADWWKEPKTFALLAREYGKYLLTISRLALVPSRPTAAVGVAHR